MSSLLQMRKLSPREGMWLPQSGATQDLDLGGSEARLLPSSTEKERCSLETLFRGSPDILLPQCSAQTGTCWHFSDVLRPGAALGAASIWSGRPRQVGVEGPGGHLEPTALFWLTTAGVCFAALMFPPPCASFLPLWPGLLPQGPGTTKDEPMWGHCMTLGELVNSSEPACPCQQARSPVVLACGY